MVRPGILLYGLQPDLWMAGRFGDFCPVMQLKTTVSMLKEVPAGTAMSYNRTFTTQTPSRLATVPIGYADGYFRSASNRVQMVVSGMPAPVVGRVCMDQCMLDVTALPDLQEGAEVTVFGCDDLTADDLAHRLDTIGYEVVCNVHKRVPRVYLQNGQLAEIVDELIDG
jgi:alanine racemase